MANKKNVEIPAEFEAALKYFDKPRDDLDRKAAALAEATHASMQSQAAEHERNRVVTYHNEKYYKDVCLLKYAPLSPDTIHIFDTPWYRKAEGNTLYYKNSKGQMEEADRRLDLIRLDNDNEKLIEEWEFIGYFIKGKPEVLARRMSSLLKTRLDCFARAMLRAFKDACNREWGNDFFED